MSISQGWINSNSLFQDIDLRKLLGLVHVHMVNMRCISDFDIVQKRKLLYYFVVQQLIIPFLFSSQIGKSSVISNQFQSSTFQKSKKSGTSSKFGKSSQFESRRYRPLAPPSPSSSFCCRQLSPPSDCWLYICVCFSLYCYRFNFINVHSLIFCNVFI